MLRKVGKSSRRAVKITVRARVDVWIILPWYCYGGINGLKKYISIDLL